MLRIASSWRRRAHVSAISFELPSVLANMSRQARWPSAKASRTQAYVGNIYIYIYIECVCIYIYMGGRVSPPLYSVAFVPTILKRAWFSPKGNPSNH